MKRSTRSIAKQSPQERAVRKRRETWNAACKEIGRQDTVDWRKFSAEGNHFDPLSDEEWAIVWNHVVVASRSEAPDNERQIRDLVDGAALSSGWFIDYGIAKISSAHYRELARGRRRFLKKVDQFRKELIEQFGDPPSDHKEPYDPWDRHRSLVPLLGNLSQLVKRDIARFEDNASMIKDPPNSSKFELDRWRTGLIGIWQAECKLEVSNSKALRGFLLDALRPYMPRAELTDRMAKHFIERWVAGKVAATD